MEVRNAAKEVGSFYMCPGLDLLTTCGEGPIRGKALKAMGSLLYVVSGDEVYSVTTNYQATLLGTIGTSSGPVSMISNGTQLQIFDGQAAYLVPGGVPLTGGAIGSAGADYIVGDVIYLLPSDGAQTATAYLNVTTVNGTGGVTGFTVAASGAFSSPPTGFSQQSTSGAGSGFMLASPTYGANNGVYTVPLPFSGPVSGSYQEGFGVVNESGTDKWWQSNLFDLSVYQPLNFSSADGLQDNIVAIHEVHLEQWLFKQTNIEVWINAGQPNFAFQRLAGVFIEFGCVAPFSVSKAGERLIWLSQSAQGEGQVMMSNGYQPVRISTHAIEHSFASYSTMADAIGFTYQQEGHTFYVITFPTGNETWVYDVTESQAAGMPMWHQRAAFSNGQFSRHWANAQVFFNSQTVVGDYRNGNLYAFNLNTLTDNGATRKWLRTWRAFPKPVDEPVRFNSLIVDAQSGIGVTPVGSNPQVMLRWSDDGGYTWSNIRTSSVGMTGQTAARILFTRMGSTRSFTGLDRVFELSSTDQFAVALVGARIDVDGQSVQR